MNLDFEKLLKTVPLLRINSITDNEVYGLMEKYNVSWSIKVKAVYRMLKQAFENWELDSSKTIIESSSWNTWVALAYLSNLFWYKLQIILPTTTADSKKRLIKEYWWEIIEVVSINPDSCIKKRNEIFSTNPDKYYMLDQYSNYANMMAHYELTWPYIHEKLWKIDFLVVWLGTTWTIIGTAKYLKEVNPNIKIIAINSSTRIEWLRNHRMSKITIPFYEEYKHLIDYTYEFGNEDWTLIWVKKLAEEGIYGWYSTWANYFWTMKFLQWKKWLRWVFIAPDWLENYLDTLWTELFQQKNWD